MKYVLVWNVSPNSSRISCNCFTSIIMTTSVMQNRLLLHFLPRRYKKYKMCNYITKNLPKIEHTSSEHTVSVLATSSGC